MNFLAHLYLSGEDQQVMLGNFIADFVKGKQALEAFPPGIIRGIQLHRTIDAFTDSHTTVAVSKNRLRPRYRHYAGVIVDVFYDHFLAAHWDTFHPQPLSAFAAHAYDVLQTHEAILPPAVQQMLPYMMRGNWLLNYGRTEGIHRALTGMSRRTPYESHMDEAVQDLIAHYASFEQEFLDFFPALRQHAEDFLQRPD